MKGKKKIALALAALTAVTWICGCGAKKEEVSNGELETVTLKMFYFTNSGKEKDQDLVTEEINKILKEKLNCTVEIETPDISTFNTKLPLMLQSQEQLDIIWANYDILLKNIPKSAFLELDTLLDEYGQGIKDAIEPTLLDGCKVNGKIYGIPVNKEFAENKAIFYRKEFADKYQLNFDEVDTLLELDGVFQKITGNEEGYAPLYLSKSDFQPPMPYSEEYKDRYVDIPGISWLVLDTKTDKIMNRYETEGYKETLKLYQKWYNEGVINKDALVTTVSAWDALKNGKGWFVVGSGKPAQINSMSKDYGFEVAQGYTTDPEISIRSLLGSVNAIPFTSKDPERAMMVLNLMYADKDLMNLFVYGIEGKHYTKVDDETIKLPEGAQSAADTGYNPGVDWKLGNSFLLYQYDYVDPDKKRLYQEYNASAKEGVLFDFILDQESFKSQVASTNAVYEEYNLSFKVGAINVDEALPEFIEKLNNNGAQTIIEETQKQYDAWKASK